MTDDREGDNEEEGMTTGCWGMKSGSAEAIVKLYTLVLYAKPIDLSIPIADRLTVN